MSSATAFLRCSWLTARQQRTRHLVETTLRSATPSAAYGLPAGHSAHTAASSSSGSRPPRFYVPSPLHGAGPGTVLRLPSEEARHATKTLRLREGDRLELCDGQGLIVEAQLLAVDRAGAEVTPLDTPMQVPRTGWQWEVACACGSLKGGRSDWLVEKCTELGAATFTPLLTERSPTIGSGGGEGRAHSSKRAGRRKGGEDAEGDEDLAGSGREGRWARVATAAMKQCLRPHALALAAPSSVQQLCMRIRAADAAIVGVAGAPPLSAVVAQLPLGPKCRHGILAIGPEGDWTAEELAVLVSAGAQPVALGDLRLRAETAAVALLSYVRMQLSPE